jgi:orotate phosphoribosyltransferase
MTQEEIYSLFRDTGALLEGHFVLSSGLHSPRYIQCAKILQHPKHAERLCREIADRFRDRMVEVVIAPALGGIVVGQEVGRQLGARTIFAEREQGTLVLRRGFEIRPGERVLVCEDVITTGGSVEEVLEIVRSAGGILLGVGAIVDRSGGRATFEDFYPIATLDVKTYTPENCPLCSAGLAVQRPGSRGSGGIPGRAEPPMTF